MPDLHSQLMAADWWAKKCVVQCHCKARDGWAESVCIAAKPMECMMYAECTPHCNSGQTCRVGLCSTLDRMLAGAGTTQDRKDRTGHDRTKVLCTYRRQFIHPKALVWV